MIDALFNMEACGTPFEGFFRGEDFGVGGRDGDEVYSRLFVAVVENEEE
jgi:hypothetical protein